MASFGQKLRKLRKARFISQQKVANDLGLSQSTIASYENDVREPSFQVINTIAKYFGVPATSLMPSSDEGVSNDLVYQLADSLHKNPKLSLLFDRSRYLSEQDLDAVLAVINSIQRGRDES